MGTDLSCFNTTRLQTLPESNLDKSLTDDEKTEFLANTNSIFLEGILKKKTQDPDSTLNLPNLLYNPSYHINTLPAPKSNNLTPLSNLTSTSLSPEKLPQSSPCLKKTRIYSSNLSLTKSINLINTLDKSTSACSSNLNSKSNSRCVSPFTKSRLYLADF